MFPSELQDHVIVSFKMVIDCKLQLKMDIPADALHTQKNTASYLVDEKHAAYIFIVKDKQKSLKNDLRDLNLVSFPPSTSDHR